MIAALLATRDVSDESIVSALVVFLIACLVAVGVFVGCRAAGRPDWGGAGAAAVLIVGGILALLAAT